jgi:hypothetical protein
MITPHIIKLLRERLGPELSHDIIKFSQENPTAIPSRFMESAYAKFCTGIPRHNGKLFEGLFLAILGRAGLSHVILDAEYSCLPYSTVDVAIYNDQKSPALISLKSSLRERWKQSDLEFSRIKSLNPRAVCAIATLEDAGMPLRLLEENRLLGSDFIVDCRVPSHWEKFLSKIIKSKNTVCTEDKLLGLIDYKHRS